MRSGFSSLFAAKEQCLKMLQLASVCLRKLDDRCIIIKTKTALVSSLVSSTQVPPKMYLIRCLGISYAPRYEYCS